jgi:hypothetical protein
MRMKCNLKEVRIVGKREELIYCSVFHSQIIWSNTSRCVPEDCFRYWDKLRSKSLGDSAPILMELLKSKIKHFLEAQALRLNNYFQC